MEEHAVNPSEVTRKWAEIQLTGYELRVAVALYLQQEGKGIPSADHIAHVRAIADMGPREDAYKRGMRWSILISNKAPCPACQWPPKPVIGNEQDKA